MTTTYPTKGKGNRPTQWPAALIEEAHQLWLNPSWTIEGIATKYRVSPKSIVSLKERQGWPNRVYVPPRFSEARRAEIIELRASGDGHEYSRPKANALPIVARRCLNCRETFHALGKFLRLCTTCRKA